MKKQYSLLFCLLFALYTDGSVYAQNCPGPLFGPITNLTGVCRPSSMAQGDLNGDGKIDFVVENGCEANLSALSVYLGNGTGGFSGPVHYTVNGNSRNVQIGDFNKDGKADLVSTSFGTNNVALLLGNGSGGFGLPSYFSVGNQPWGIAVGDFNLDSNPDLAVANSYYDSTSSDRTQWHGSDSISILLGDGLGGFAPAATVKVGQGPMYPVTGDFNRDGFPDLVVGNFFSYNVSILFGNGTGTFAPPVNYPVDPYGGATYAAIGDIDGDNWPDMAVTNYYTASVTVFLNNGNGDFRFAGKYPVNRGALFTQIGDINDDDHPDLAVLNVASDKISLFMGNGVGGFGNATHLSFGRAPHYFVMGDYNSDGRPDLAVPIYVTNRISLLFNTLSGADTVAPVFTISNAQPAVLNPPNHKMRDIVLNFEATDNCPGPIAYRLVSVTSNEPDNGLGDGDMPNDIEIVDDHHLRLRAERSGTGVGRVYTITITATDLFGNHSTSLMTVRVPHDNSNASAMSWAGIDPETGPALEARILNNPSRDQFTLSMTTDNNSDPIILYVYDQRGVVMEHRLLKGYQSIRIGSQYHPGIYFIKIIQGEKIKTFKAIKTE